MIENRNDDFQATHTGPSKAPYQGHEGIDASRRHFMAAAAVVGTALAASMTVPGRAMADASEQGCNSSGNQPPSCICFLAGTRIRTPQGERAIETLKIGDVVTVASGASRPIRWVGHMTFERPASGRWQESVAPVLVKKGAIDGLLPEADLQISSAHCLYIDGYLVPVGQLVNGITIIQQMDYSADQLTYFHIELDTHDVVIANGAPAETYQGSENRIAFDNHDEYVALYGDALNAMAPFAPVVGNFGGRQALRSHLRSALAPVYDMRQPFERIRDGIEAKARRARAA